MAHGLTAHLRLSLQQHAHRMAVEGAHWVLSYRDLDQASERLAARLQQAGLTAGQRVPMLMGRSPQFVVAMLAVLRCGAVYAPIDLASPAARQAAMVEALGGRLLLVDSTFDAAEWPHHVVVDVADVLATTPAVEPRGVPWPDTLADAPACALFTSGSTGVPKCVLVPHRGIVRLVVNADYAAFSADSRWLQLASLAFDAATLELWAPLLHGGCCVIQQQALPSLDELADHLLTHGITDAWLTSALFNAVVDARPDAFGGLRQLLIGGERISLAHARACLQRWPRLRLINGYGPTENTTFSLCHTLTLDELSPATGEGAHSTPQVPIGRPIRGTLARLAPLPADSAQPGSEVTAPAHTGELWLAGDGLALGYLNDAERTARQFVEHDGLRWYRTGDCVARRADGVFEFHGRLDRQVKLQGHRIELEEIERTAMQCPGVGAAVVWVVGEAAESRHVVGCYSGAVGMPAPAVSAVADFLRQRLPPPAVPKVLHRLERLPVNLNGKVDRAALMRQHARQSPAGTEGVPLQTETEQQLAAIWQRCLPQAAVVHRQSDFASLGGSSLLALRVAADVERILGRCLAALEVLRQPVLHEQARLIDAAPRVSADAASIRENSRLLGAAATPGPALSRSQRLLLQASRLDPSGAAYHIHVALHLRRGLAPRRLRRGFAALMARHPLLRTAVAFEGDAVRSWTLPAPPAGWWTKGAALAAIPLGAHWPAPLMAALNTPWDLASGGTMRLRCWPLPGGEHLCVWTVHHFALDEASIAIALDELDQLLCGKRLPPVHGSPAHFADVETAGLDEAALTAQAAQVALAWQSERSRPLGLATAPGQGSEQPLPLPEELAPALADAAARWGCTPLTPLMVAYGLALQQVFGAAWRFALTPFSRRMAPELMAPIGCLLELRLIEAGARAGEDLPATLARVHGELLAGQQPRFRPLDRLADLLAEQQPAWRHAVTQFALTWRPQVAAQTSLGGQPVALLPVPQHGARFGLTLHIEQTDGVLAARVEAVQPALDDGCARALGLAFIEQLQRVCELKSVQLASGIAATTAVANRPTPAPPAVVQQAHAAWQRWLQRPPQGPDDDFLRAGGSSLRALQMAAGLRRDAGLQLDVAAFLAQPSFGALCAQLAQARPAKTKLVTLVGAADAAHLLLLLPGGEGGPLGMFRLARELHARLPDNWAVAIVDLQAIMQRAGEAARAPFFAQTLLQVVRDLGEHRLAAVAGFSLGGLLGLDLLNLLAPQRAASVALWLIDTYAPQRMRLGRRAMLTRMAINLLRHPLETLGLISRRLGGGHEGSNDDPGAATPSSPEWRAFMVELSTRRFEGRHGSVTLIHSSSGARTSGLLRHTSSNGFAPRRFARFTVITVEDAHIELPRSAAVRVATLISQGLLPALPA